MKVNEICSILRNNITHNLTKYYYNFTFLNESSNYYKSCCLTNKKNSDNNKINISNLT